MTEYQAQSTNLGVEVKEKTVAIDTSVDLEI